MVQTEQQQLLQQLQNLLGGAKKRSTKAKKVSRKPSKATKGKKVMKRRRVRGGVHRTACVATLRGRARRRARHRRARALG